MSQVEQSSSSSSSSVTTRIIKFAIVARACVVAWACIASAIGAPYDSSRFITSPLTGVPTTSAAATSTSSLLPHPHLRFPNFDSFLDTYIVGPLCVWDGVYFIHIAQHGYTYEHFHAFFPMYPAVVRLIRQIVFAPFEYLRLISPTTSLKAAALCTSNVCFILAAVLLYHLTCRVFQTRSSILRATKGRGAMRTKSVVRNDTTAESMAMLTSLLFCITPAGVFMSAAYSESLYAFLSFGGMLLLEYGLDQAIAKARGEEDDAAASAVTSHVVVLSEATSKYTSPFSSIMNPYMIPATILFVGAAASRSNGMVLIGYLIWHFLYSWMVKAVLLSSSSSIAAATTAAVTLSPPKTIITDKIFPFLASYTSFIRSLLLLIICCGSVISSFILVEYAASWRYCGGALEDGANDDDDNNNNNNNTVIIINLLRNLVSNIFGYEIMPYILPLQADGHAINANTAAIFPPWCPAPTQITSPSSTSWSHYYLPPPMYASVQDRFWGVGLFRYWQVKHIGMFLLAAPTLLIVLAYSWTELYRLSKVLDLKMIVRVCVEAMRKNSLHWRTAAATAARFSSSSSSSSPAGAAASRKPHPSLRRLGRTTTISADVVQQEDEENRDQPKLRRRSGSSSSSKTTAASSSSSAVTNYGGRTSSSLKKINTTNQTATPSASSSARKMIDFIETPASSVPVQEAFTTTPTTTTLPSKEIKGSSTITGGSSTSGSSRRRGGSSSRSDSKKKNKTRPAETQHSVEEDTKEGEAEEKEIEELIQNDDHEEEDEEEAREQILLFLQSLRPLPYIIHALVFTLVAITSMHVQVATRFLAACPSLYWGTQWLFRQSFHSHPPPSLPPSSHIREYKTKDGTRADSRRTSVVFMQKNVPSWPSLVVIFILVHSLGYTFVGTALFANFYNWT